MQMLVKIAFFCMWLPGVGLSLPISGVCERSSELMGSIKVDWRGTDAVVIQGDTITPGSVIGMRSHESGFKFSIIYEDPIMGASEITVFQLRTEDSQSRLGVVVYEDIPGDGLVVSSIIPFMIATCIILE